MEDKQGIAPGGGETICPPPPADGSSIQKSRRIYVRPRTGPQSAHLWWPAVAKLQAASDYALYKSTHSLTHQAAAPWDRQTDGSRYSKCPPPRRGIIKQTEEARASEERH